MNNSETIQQATAQAISLIDGVFTPSETADILNEMLDIKINFHKLQSIKRFEGNHDDPCTHDSGRLAQLLEQKEILRSRIKEVRSLGKKMKVISNISIEVVD